MLYGVHWGAPETMSWQRLKQFLRLRVCMDWTRRGARSPQGLKPHRVQMFMSELKLRPPREEER